MTSPTSHQLRREAKALREAARRTWFLSEELLEQATAMNAEAQRMEQQADTLDELRTAEPFVGSQIKPRKERRVA